MIAALVSSLELQRAVVHRVTTDDLARPSRCDGWTLGHVLRHSVGVTRKFTAFASGATDAPRTPPGDHLGELDRVVDDATAAWSSVDRARTCTLPFGTFTAEAAAGINLFDVLAHTWDVASTVGIELDGHLELWSLGLDAARLVLGHDRDARHYGAELPPASGAPMHRLVAYLGYPS